LLVLGKNVFLRGENFNKNIVMALAIKSAPVLEGKAAREFYKRAAEATETKSKEYVQESFRKSREFFAKQKLFD